MPTLAKTPRAPGVAYEGGETVASDRASRLGAASLAGHVRFGAPRAPRWRDQPSSDGTRDPWRFGGNVLIWAKSARSQQVRTLRRQGAFRSSSSGDAKLGRGIDGA